MAGHGQRLSGDKTPIDRLIEGIPSKYRRPALVPGEEFARNRSCFCSRSKGKETEKNILYLEIEKFATDLARGYYTFFLFIPRDRR